MNLLFVLLGFAGIAACNLPELIKDKQWRDLIIYSILFTLVFTIAVLMALDITIPSPIKAIQAFFRDVLHLSFKSE